MPMPRPVSRRLLFVGRSLLTVLVAVYVFRRVDWGGLGQVLRVTNPAGLIAAIGLQGCGIAVAATRWRVLLANQGIPASWPRVARLTLTGLFFNLFFLGSVGGDAARFAGALTQAPERKAGLVLSLVQDRLIGLGALLLLLVACMGVQGPRLWDEPALRPLVFVATAGGAAFAAAAAGGWLLAAAPAGDSRAGPRSWWARSRRVVRTLMPRPVFFPCLALSFAVHALVMLSGWLAARAVGIGISFPAATVVLGVTALAVSLPLTLVGLGVRDGVLLWLLAAFGFRSTAAAIGLSSSLLGITLFWALVGGLVFHHGNPGPSCGHAAGRD